MILKNTYRNLGIPGKFRISKLLIYGFSFGSLSYILIILNALGNHDLAISIALIQSSLSIATSGFGSNSRSILLAKILGKSYFLSSRLLLSLFSIFFISLYLVVAAPNHALVLFLLSLRKLSDWLDEIPIARNSGNKNNISNTYYFIAQSFFLILFPFLDFNNSFLTCTYLIIWIFFTFILFFNFYRKNLKYNLITKNFLPSANKTFAISALLATLIPTLAGYLYRYRAYKIFDIGTASMLISSFAIAGAFTSFLIYVFLPEFINEVGKSKSSKRTLYLWASIITSLSFILIFITYHYQKNLEVLNFSYKYIILGSIAGITYLFSNVIKVYLIQKYKISTLFEEFNINLVLISLIVFSQLSYSANLYFMLPLIASILSLLIYDIRSTYLVNTFTPKKFFYIALFLFCIIFISLISFSQGTFLYNPLFKFYLFCLSAFVFFFFSTVLKYLSSIFISSSFFIYLIPILLFLFRRFLYLEDTNYSSYIFFVVMFVAHYLFVNIKTFINLGFLDFIFSLYLLFLTVNLFL